ncbi:MAG: AAA family ATPase [Polyangiales bacterium]
MIGTLRVVGFKSLRDVSVDLGIVNVFIGANGSGKSNLLEALGVLGAASFGSVEPETLRYRGVRPGIPSLYKTSFKSRTIPRLIKLSVSAADADYSVGLDNPITKPEPRWGIVSETLRSGSRDVLTRSPRGCNGYASPGWRKTPLNPQRSETGARLALQQNLEATAARSLLDALVDYAIYAPSTLVLRGLSHDIDREPLGLGGSGIGEAVRDLTREDEDGNELLGPFDYDEVWELIEWARWVHAMPADRAPISPAVKVGSRVLTFRDRYMAPKRNRLTAYDASEGALYVLFLLALVSHPRAPKLFAIDNFDHALHPRLACRLTRMVCEALVRDGSRQMLLTTHNPLLLDGLDLRNERIRLFAVDRARRGERNPEGQPLAPGETVVRRVKLSEALLDEVENGMSLSRLWIMGRLGGVPGNL